MNELKSNNRSLAAKKMMARLRILPVIISALMAICCPTRAEANEGAEPNKISGGTAVSEPISTLKTEDQNNNSPRIYLDLYGFLPWQTITDLTINGNDAPTMHQDLREILEPVTAIFTGRAGLEFGRIGVQFGVNYGESYTSDKFSHWEQDNPIRNATEATDYFPSLIQKKRIKSSGDIYLDNNFKQTVIDIALRYRGGAVASPRMKSGDFTFIGLAGARIVDASMDTEISFSSNIEVEGLYLDKQLRKSFARSAGSRISNTWVSPLIGANAVYAFNDQWQAFVYLDVAGFDVSGKRDMSGTAQAGVAYTIGNSTQLTLSYKYWGIDFAGYGSNDDYSVSQSGVNLGLRLFFD